MNMPFWKQTHFFIEFTHHLSNGGFTCSRIANKYWVDIDLAFFIKAFVLSKL